MINSEQLALLSKEQRDHLLRMLAEDTVVYGLTFTRNDETWTCTECEHFIFLTRMGEEYEVLVGDRTGKLVAGPFTASFEMAVSWARGRCGLLPDQREAFRPRAGLQVSCGACGEFVWFGAAGRFAECKCGYLNH